jgi:hypothetical protein
VRLWDGTIKLYYDTGQEALGLTSGQAAYLFHPARSRHTVYKALVEIRDTGTLTVPDWY